jgi:hypothetical protein
VRDIERDRERRKLCIILKVLRESVEGKWMELVSITQVELALELDPMKTKSVQKCTESFHDQQHPNCACRKHKQADQSDNWV